VLGDELGLGITVFIDGEEETGSPSLPLLLQEHPTLLNRHVASRRRQRGCAGAACL
jgi:hypothetical protein